MDRRSFFKTLAGAMILPTVALPVAVVPEIKTYFYTPIDGVTLHRTSGEGNYVTIGQYADYASMQWDVGNGYLDIPGSKKMGRLR